MRKNQWAYSSNQFEVATQGSFKLMEILSADHEAKLFAEISNPGIAQLHAAFMPLRTQWVNAYTEWKHIEGRYASATQVVYEMLSKLSGEKIDNWDVRIQVVFRQASSQYKAILPDGRFPFQAGSIDLRITAVGTLVRNLGGIPALATLKNEVIQFLNEINDARRTQQGLEGTLAEKSESLEDERLEIAAGLFASVGGLMKIYRKEPWKLERYFDLENLQSRNGGNNSPPEPIVSLSLNPGATVDSGIRLEPEVLYLVTNQGNSTLRVCIGTTAGSPCNETASMLIDPFSSREITAAMLGLPEGGFLNLTNLSTTLFGSADVWFA